jgi:amino acid transporter
MSLPDSDDAAPALSPDQIDASSPGEFAGWGSSKFIRDLYDTTTPPAPDHHHASKLGPWRATAICGNDITSSCLYVSALCALYAGPYAPIALALVALVLYLFRNIYAEVGSALPLNGGAYNALLNTTTKAQASLAACLTVLSYIATAVISANEAMHYAHNFAHFDIVLATVVLLGIFALLNILGITESAVVALGIFLIHIVTLTLLVAFCGWVVFHNPAILSANWATPAPGGMAKAIFFGFAAAMLGISGFESSANFIEEQKPGVFPITLRNMWIAVAFFNPVISLLSLGTLPLNQIAANKQDLLADMGRIGGGEWLGQLVSFDATLVLSGAVLTSYVGVTGLVRRMSLDKCLPQFLLRENSWRRTNHWIIILFFLVCCSILFITGGQIETLAGVYTLSFLGVMALFAVGNMLLKVERSKLPRAVTASWPAVVLGMIAVIVGIVGNLVLNPQYVRIFMAYVAVAIAIVGVMFLRVQILRLILAVSRNIVARIRKFAQNLNQNIASQIEHINSLQVIYFSKGDNLSALNRACLYVLTNETTRNLMVVNLYEDESTIPPTLAEHVALLDRIYPRLKIDVVYVKGKFTPEFIDRLSRRLNVPKNYMFIGTPGDRFPHNIAELGGVRLIL